MTISALTGAATTTVKVSDFNAMITALNAELADLKTTITAAQGQLVETVNRIATLKTQLDDYVNTPMSDHGHGELDQRVDALEEMVKRVPAENPNPQVPTQILAKPAGLDPSKPTLVYDRATIYFHDIELYANRIDSDKWLLQATLNYVVLSPGVWTYEEIFEGTPEEVYAHAMKRLTELAELKPQHDAVHERVRAMSEGRP